MIVPFKISTFPVALEYGNVTSLNPVLDLYIPAPLFNSITGFKMVVVVYLDIDFPGAANNFLVSRFPIIKDSFPPYLGSLCIFQESRLLPIRKITLKCCNQLIFIVVHEIQLSTRHGAVCLSVVRFYNPRARMETIVPYLS